MGERYTRRDAEAILDHLRWHMRGDEELCDYADRVKLNHGSGVYRVRFVLDHGETDISPGMTTAREAWLYVRGMLDGRGLVAQCEHYADQMAADTVR